MYFPISYIHLVLYPFHLNLNFADIIQFLLLDNFIYTYHTKIINLSNFLNDRGTSNDYLIYIEMIKGSMRILN